MLLTNPPKIGSPSKASPALYIKMGINLHIGLVQSLAKNEATSRHRHPGFETYFVARGQIEFWVESDLLGVAKEGDMVLIPDNVWHMLACREDSVCFITIGQGYDKDLVEKA